MKDKFYELSIKTSNFYDEILELVFSFGITCVEELDHEIIIREEYDLKDIAWGVEEYAKGLSSVRKISNDLKISLNLKENKDWLPRKNCKNILKMPFKHKMPL